MTHSYPQSEPKLHGSKAMAARRLAKDPNYYRKIGSMGGKAPHVARGFQLMTPDQVRAAGAKGGRKKKEGKS